MWGWLFDGNPTGLFIRFISFCLLKLSSCHNLPDSRDVLRNVHSIDLMLLTRYYQVLMNILQLATVSESFT